jgi:hypothetical protein
MGLMDKVKAQATQLAQKTQETARDSKAKFDQAQGKRHGDAMLRNLGALVYADRTGRGSPDTQQQVDQLVADISAFESENGINLAAQPADQQPADSPGTAPADPAGASASRYPSAPPEPAADFGSAPPSRYPAAPPPAADFGAPPATSPAAPPPAADFGAPPATSPAAPPPAADFGAPPAASPAAPPPAADFGAPPAAAYPSAPEPPEAGSQQS